MSQLVRDEDDILNDDLKCARVSHRATGVEDRVLESENSPSTLLPGITSVLNERSEEAVPTAEKKEKK